MCVYVIGQSLSRAIYFRSGGSGGLLLKLFGLSIIGAGGIIGYAWYDEDFRKSVEDRIPYAKEVFETIYEYLPGPKSTEPVPWVQLFVTHNSSIVVDYVTMFFWLLIFLGLSVLDCIARVHISACFSKDQSVCQQ